MLLKGNSYRVDRKISTLDFVYFSTEKFVSKIDNKGFQKIGSEVINFLLDFEERYSSFFTFYCSMKEMFGSITKNTDIGWDLFIQIIKNIIVSSFDAKMLVTDKNFC